MRLIYATHLRSLSRSHVQPAVALSGGCAIAAKPLKCTIEGKRHNAFFQPTRSASLMKIAMAIASAAGLASCATTPEASPAVLSELAPGGRLRAAIHFGNPTLAVRDPVSGAPRGVSVDLSRELGRRPAVPVELVTFDAAGKVLQALQSKAVDIGFVAIDPARAIDVAYSAPTW
jgi:Bacterial extracellular solute-binding proteins, family 3